MRAMSRLPHPGCTRNMTHRPVCGDRAGWLSLWIQAWLFWAQRALLPRGVRERGQNICSGIRSPTLFTIHISPNKTDRTYTPFPHPQPPSPPHPPPCLPPAYNSAPPSL